MGKRRRWALKKRKGKRKEADETGGGGEKEERVFNCLIKRRLQAEVRSRWGKGKFHSGSTREKKRVRIGLAYPNEEGRGGGLTNERGRIREKNKEATKRNRTLLD